MFKFGRIILLLVLISIVYWLPFTTSKTTADGRKMLSRSPIPLTARLQQMAPPDMPVKGHLLLHMRNAQALDQLIQAQQDPNSPEYHQWLTPKEFGARFGQTPEHINKVVNWLNTNGIKVVRTWSNGLNIDFQAPASTIQRVFTTNVGLYNLAGQTYYAATESPTIPELMTGEINDIKLNNFTFTKPQVKVGEDGGLNPQTDAGGRFALGAQDLHFTYNFKPLFAQGIDGTGEKIGIVGRTEFDVDDINKYRSRFSLPPLNLTKIAAGGEIANRGGLDILETLLDIQVSSAAAPGADVQIVICDKDNDVDQSLLYLINNLPDTKVISVSFNLCERDLFPVFTTLFNNLFKQSAAQGQTVLVASGDAGSNDCGDGQGQQVGGLSASPFVTAVGGTSLSLKFDSSGNVISYDDEQVWPGSGGGLSLFFDRPSYQMGVNIPEGVSRAVPDISLLADPGRPGFFIVQNSFARVVGGTSASAPVWAGIFALTNQMAVSQGQQHGFGLANPRIYQMGKSQQTGGNKVFNDIVKGENSNGVIAGYPARAGFDLSSGWGTPNVDSFVRGFINTSASTQQLFLTVPNGSETFDPNEIINVQWRLDDAVAAQVTSQDLLLSINGGKTFKMVTTLPADARTYQFNVADRVTATARFRIVTHTANGDLSDTSDTDFSIATSLRIDFVNYSTVNKRLELTGTGFSAKAKLFVNGIAIDEKAVVPDDGVLTFKGKPNKLKLVSGRNLIEIKIGKTRSAIYKFSF